MKYKEYSHRHGKELLQVLHPDLLEEVQTILTDLDAFPHGAQKQHTVKDYLTQAFCEKGWQREGRADFNTDKRDYVDLVKWNVAAEMEFSRFEMFFRDFFRFMLLYEYKKIDVGIIITFDDMAYRRWNGEAKSYESVRASLPKLVDFLRGDYSSIVHVPIWCIGIE